MRSIRTSILALGLIALISIPALAQRPGGSGRGRGMGMGFGGGLQLLTAPPVQQELKLSEEQIQKAEAAANELREGVFGSLQGLRDATPEERQEKISAIQKEMEEKTRTALADILEPEQQARFDEIRLQQEGFQALDRPEVQARLELNEEQKGQIAQIAQEARDEMSGLMQAMRNAEGDRAESILKIQSVRQQAMTRALGVLNNEQQATWQLMTGEPFELGPFGRGGGRGPGGRRPGGGGF